MRNSIILLLVLFSCSQEIVSTKNSYHLSSLPDELSKEKSTYLKIHLKNGKVAVIRSWEIDNEAKTIVGEGQVYSANRERATDFGDLMFDFDNCVMLETNDYRGINAISPILMTLTIFTSVFAIPCLANPKSCFGSCPTYYLHQGDSLIIQAEGFSSSITRSMEEVDIDFLPAYQPSEGHELKLELRNEALETHYIRQSDILAVSKPINGEAYYGNGHFYTGSRLSQPKRVNNGDVQLLTLLETKDRKEYWSKSDGTEIPSEESIILEFDKFNGASTGIVITQRQSLMTTYLFYQSMAYMGSRLGELMAAYERASPLVRNAQKSMYDILGGVRISVLINGKWREVGTIDEQGPITTDTHIIPVGISGDFREVKLTMTKGLWRIDQVGLATIYEEQSPVIIQPNKLLNYGLEDTTLLKTLNDPEKMLINNPGTSYTLVYELPRENNLSLFLRSQGYYTEWMRNQWLQEEDQKMIRLILTRPKKWLTMMSPSYKMIETKMDSLFWKSKFGYGEY